MLVRSKHGEVAEVLRKNSAPFCNVEQITLLRSLCSLCDAGHLMVRRLMTMVTQIRWWMMDAWKLMRQKQGGCFQEEAHKFKHKHRYKVTLKIYNQGGKRQEEISPHAFKPSRPFHIRGLVSYPLDQDIFCEFHSKIPSFFTPYQRLEKRIGIQGTYWRPSWKRTDQARQGRRSKLWS